MELASPLSWPAQFKKVKIVMLGDRGVGKTSLARAYQTGRFDSSPTSTIGIEFVSKIMPVDKQGRLITLQLWELAGQDSLARSIGSRGFWRETDACLVLFDCTCIESLENARKWRQTARETLPSDTPCILVGNKYDLTPLTTEARIQTVVAESGFTGWKTCSAKDQLQIAELFSYVVSKVVVAEGGKRAVSASDEGRMELVGSEAETRKKCC